MGGGGGGPGARRCPEEEELEITRSSYEGRNLQFLFAILSFLSHVLLKQPKTSMCRLDL